MKKFYLLSILLFLNFCAFSQSSTNAHFKNSKWQTKVMVSWGNPENNCTGFGICKLYKKNDVGFNLKESTPATIELINNNLLMILNRDDLKSLKNISIYNELCDARSIHLPAEVVFSDIIQSNSKNQKNIVFTCNGTNVI